MPGYGPLKKNIAKFGHSDTQIEPRDLLSHWLTVCVRCYILLQSTVNSKDKENGSAPEFILRLLKMMMMMLLDDAKQKFEYKKLNLISFNAFITIPTVLYFTNIKNGTSSYKKLRIKCYIFYNIGTFYYFHMYRYI